MCRPGILFLLLYLIMPLPVLAQHVKKVPAKRSRASCWTINDCLAIILTPSSALDPYGALLPAGVSYYFGERYSVSIEAGFPLYYVLNNYRDKPRKSVNSDYRLRTDVRQYFLPGEKNRLYAGAELFFRRQAMTLDDSYLHFVDETSYTYGLIHAVKTSFGTGFFLGTARRLSEHFLCEGHIGVGIRFIKMRTDLDTTGRIPVMQASFTSLVPPNEDRIGDRNLNIYLPFALKIVYLF